MIVTEKVRNPPWEKRQRMDPEENKTVQRKMRRSEGTVGFEQFVHLSEIEVNSGSHCTGLLFGFS